MSFKCEICKKKCSNEKQLEKHMKWHTCKVGNFDIKCELCDRLFNQQRYLEYHEFFAHVRKKPTVKCEICNKVFAYKRSFVRHNRSFHLNRKEYVCYICNKAFVRKEYLNKHYSVHEGGNDNDQEQSEMKVFKSLTVPETKSKRKKICVKRRSAKNKLVNDTEEMCKSELDLAVKSIINGEHGNGDFETDLETLGPKESTIEKVYEGNKVRNYYKGNMVKNEFLTTVTRKFGCLRYVEEYVHKPNYESGNAESNFNVVTNKSESERLSMELENEDKGCVEVHKSGKRQEQKRTEREVDRNKLETDKFTASGQDQSDQRERSDTQADGLNKDITNNMKQPLYVNLKSSDDTKNDADKPEQGDRKDLVLEDEVVNMPKQYNMADHTEDKLISTPASDKLDLKIDPQNSMWEDKTGAESVERLGRKRKSNLDCWKMATGGSNIKVSSYNYASVDVVEYSSKDVLVVECFEDNKQSILDDMESSGNDDYDDDVDGNDDYDDDDDDDDHDYGDDDDDFDDDDDDLSTEIFDDERMIVVNNNTLNSNQNNVNDKGKSFDTEGTIVLSDDKKDYKEAKTKVVDDKDNERMKDFCSDIVVSLEQNEAELIRQIEDSDQSEIVISEEHDVQEGNHLYRNFITKDLNKSVRSNSNGHIKVLSPTKELRRVENLNSYFNTDVEKRTEFKGFIDKRNQNRDEVIKIESKIESEGHKTSKNVSPTRKVIAAKRKIIGDDKCEIIDSRNLSKVCTDYLPTKNTQDDKSENLEDFDDLLNWLVEHNECNGKSLEEIPSNQSMENRNKKVASTFSEKDSSDKYDGSSEVSEHEDNIVIKNNKRDKEKDIVLPGSVKEEDIDQVQQDSIELGGQ